jgi:paraquat-inducible protein A
MPNRLNASATEKHLLRFGVILATVMFLAGAFLPMMTLHQLVVFDQSFSVVAGVVELFVTGKYLLGVVIGSFSLLIPAIKLVFLGWILITNHQSESQRKLVQLMHAYGRWSMLDVMVVAVLLVTVKLGAIASVSVHAGLYSFGGAVLLIMLITQRVEKLAKGVRT